MSLPLFGNLCAQNQGASHFVATKLPDPVVQRRHHAAMEIIHELDQHERVLLLAYVSAGSERLREFEEQEKAA